MAELRPELFADDEAAGARARLRQHIGRVADAVGDLAHQNHAQHAAPQGRRLVARSPTKRELAVLVALWRFLDSAAAARSLGMAHGTFRRHVSDLIRRFHVSNWAQAVRVAQEVGWLPRGLPEED